MMKIRFVLVMLLFCSWIGAALSQDIAILAKEAENMERQLKEPEALAKYKQILVLEPNLIKYLVKAAELEIAIGGREKNENNKRLYFESAMAYAQRALKADPNNADANYVMATVSGKMTDLDIENKKIVAYVKDVKEYADKALSINPNHARANYTLGKWHYEMVTLSGIKKAAVKLFYGGLPNGDLDKAILYMEKSRTLEPYFVTNQLDLAKAYKENRQPAKAIEILERLVKMPNRSFNDIALKAEGAQLLASLQ
jgi:tetratricopeptide (TPR) repeat protein